MFILFETRLLQAGISWASISEMTDEEIAKRVVAVDIMEEVQLARRTANG